MLTRLSLLMSALGTPGPAHVPGGALPKLALIQLRSPMSTLPLLVASPPRSVVVPAL